MASRFFLPVLGLVLSLAMLHCGSGSNAPQVPAKVFHSPHLQGTFFSQNTYQDGQWRSTFEAMQAAGLTQAVVNASADATAMTTRYPTSLPGFTMVYPTLPQAFPNATTQRIDMYLGLQSSDDWWTSSSTDPVWLAAQATLSNQVADELFALYGKEPAFKGWYLPFEVDNATFPTSDEWDLLVAYYTPVVSHLHTLAPGKPVIIAPFFNASYGLDSTGWRAMWAYILAQVPIDVMAVQDGVGAGNTTVDVLPEWFQATKGAIADAKSKCLLWSDTETYNIVDFSTMPINGIVADMEAVAPSVTNMLSWSFSDYLDPHTANPFYYLTYLHYAVDGTMDVIPPTVPTHFSAQASDSNDVTLTWTASVDDVGVVAYDLDRDGTVTRIYVSGGPYADSGLTGGTTYTYAIAAVDAAGNASQETDPQEVTTPVDPVYPLDLAKGLPYTTSSQPDPGYPDWTGMGLTDGAYGTSDFTDPAWQGRLNGGNTWTIDLGSLQTIHEMNSDWLLDDPSGIELPISVTYSYSTDGVNYLTAGTATPGVVPATLWHKVYKVNRLNVTGRYVQITAATLDGDWSFIDEIEVRQ